MSKTAKAPAASNDAQIAQTAADLQQFWDQTIAWTTSHYLSIAIACTIGTAIVAALYGLRYLGGRLCRREHLGHWPRIIGRAITRTNLFFMVMLAAKIVSGYAQPPEMVTDTVRFLFTVAAAIQAAMWVRELIIGIVEYRAGDDEGYSTLGSAIGIIRLLVTSICFIVAMLLILDNVGVNITGLVASLGIGGIAIGLAAQGIFSDLFASLAIIFDRPFRRGDTVKWDQTTGTVESIGLKTTRVRANTGEEVIISNTNLLNKELHNLAHTMRRRVTINLGVTYQTPPDVIRRIPDLVKDIVNTQDKAAFIHCWLVNLAPSSLDHELQFDVIDEDGEVFNRVRHEVFTTILDRFAKEGIDFAYPTQTTFTAAPDGTIVMPYPDPERPARPAPKAKPKTA